MKFKHCLQCGSMGFTKKMNREICAKCGSDSIGEGAMDEINKLQKSLKSGVRPAAPYVPPKEGTLSQLKEKMTAMRGKKTDDFEVL